MDPRTLRRQLALDGATYREVVDEARRTHAVELLEDGWSVSRTAAELGYREVGSFSRAFHRWTGCAPSASRHRDVPVSANTLP
jgi:AraC-like DNA-binding protein